MTIGIYKITNNTNGKFYIGRSADIDKRLYCHKKTLETGTHYCKELQKDFNKNKDFVIFKCKIIEECKEEELGKKEYFWIKELKAIELGYNTITPVLEKKIDKILSKEDQRVRSLKKIIGTDTIAKCLEVPERYIYNLYNAFKRIWSKNKRIPARDNYLLQCSITKKIKELNDLITLIENEY